MTKSKNNISSNDEFLKKYRPNEYERRKGDRAKNERGGTGLVDEFLSGLKEKFSSQSRQARR